MSKRFFLSKPPVRARLCAVVRVADSTPLNCYGSQVDDSAYGQPHQLCDNAASYDVFAHFVFGFFFSSIRLEEFHGSGLGDRAVRLHHTLATDRSETQL